MSRKVLNDRYQLELKLGEGGYVRYDVFVVR